MTLPASAPSFKFAKLASLIAALFLTATNIVSAAGPLELKIEQPTSPAAGEPLQIPFVLNGQNVSVDGVQLSIKFSGATLSDPVIEVNSDLRLQAVAQELNSEGLGVMLIPQNPGEAVKIEGEMPLLTLSGTPTTTGELTLKFNLEDTLAPDSQNGENVMSVPDTVIVNVSPAENTTSVATTPETEAIPEKERPMVIWAGLLGLIALGVVGLLYWFYKARQTPATPPTPTAPPTLPV